MSTSRDDGIEFTTSDGVTVVGDLVTPDHAVGAAIVGTVCVFVAALVLYVLRIIRPTNKMAFGVTAAIFGLGLLYFFDEAFVH